MLIVEIDDSEGEEEILQQLEEKFGEGFFSRGGMPFLVNAKGKRAEKIAEKVEEFLKERGFKPLLAEEKRETSKDEFSKRLEQLPSNNVLVINKNLRAGQSVEHTGDVLIIGNVNPGAVVKATGNIIVMGSLKGVAWAGYLGNQDAVIIALKMEPSQLRIANIIAVNEEEERQAPDYPEIARIENGEVVIKRLV